MPRPILILTLFAAAIAQSQQLQLTTPLGKKFYAQPDEKGVIPAAQKALDADPKNPSLILKLALAQSSVRDYRDAVATCTRGLAIAPDNADLLIERGHRELGLREFTKARSDLSRAVHLDPKKLDGYYHLGLAHYFLGEFAASAEAFHHAVDLAPDTDSRINSSNWLYASLRRANKPEEAAKALAQITPEMKNTEPHTFFYLSLLRYFQGRMPESEAVPPEPPRDAADPEPELRYDTVAYGVGNWYLYNGDSAKAQEYFHRIVKGQMWMTWGFVGAEREVVQATKSH